MVTTVRFPARLSFVCSEVAEAQTAHCDDCYGIGWIFWNDNIDWYREKCLCGGSDDRRIELSEEPGDAPLLQG